MNLAQMRTRLQALGYGSDTEDAQNEALRACYQMVTGLRRWSWLERDSTILTTDIGFANVELLPVPDLMWVDAVRIEESSRYYDLEHVQPQEFRVLEHTERDTGRPVCWTEIAGELRFWPTPDAVYTIALDYVTTPPELEDNADEPLFDDQYHNVLVWGAAVSLAYRERDHESAQFAQIQYDRHLASMLAAYGVTQRQTARRVVHNTHRWRDWNRR